MLGPVQGKRPDITPAQIVGIVPVLAALLSAFGVGDLNPEQKDALESAITYSLVLLGADAFIRIGRNVKDAKVEAAAIAKDGEPAGPGTVGAAPIEATPLVPEEVLGVNGPTDFTPDDIDEVDDPIDLTPPSDLTPDDIDEIDDPIDLAPEEVGGIDDPIDVPDEDELAERLLEGERPVP